MSENTNIDVDLSGRGASWAFLCAIAVPAIVVMGGYTWWQVSPWERHPTAGVSVAAVERTIRHFEVTERSGQPFRSSDMRGQVWVVSYFFATCPGSCSLLNKNIQALNGVSDLQDVVWVSITCDPETDTLSSLREYADRYDADPQRWLFCRTKLTDAKRIASDMKVRLARRGHQDDAIVIDRSGKIRGTFDLMNEGHRRRLRAKLMECLSETSSEDTNSEDGAIANRNKTPDWE